MTPLLPPDAPFPRRLGVVMLTALGDAVHVLPVLTAIRRHAPDTHITWVLQPGPAALVRGHPAVDELLIFDRRAGWRAFLAVRRALRERPFDLVLALQTYLKAGIITALARAPVKLGFDRARAGDLNWLFTTHRLPPRPPRHVQDQFLEFLDALGVPHGAPVWDLAPTAEERRAARALVREADGPLVGLVAGTTKAPKNWLPERYAELAARVRRELGGTCVVLGGSSPPERATRDAVTARAEAAALDTTGCDLRTLLGLLDACDVVVSPDTGPLHIAVALGVPVIGLYGYTNPKRVGPYRSAADLLVDAYGDCGEDYPVSGAYRPGRMGRITVEMVFARVRTALERGSVPWRRVRPV